MPAMLSEMDYRLRRDDEIEASRAKKEQERLAAIRKVTEWPSKNKEAREQLWISVFIQKGLEAADTAVYLFDERFEKA